MSRHSSFRRMRWQLLMRRYGSESIRGGVPVSVAPFKARTKPTKEQQRADAEQAVREYLERGGIVRRCR
jgi:hypothetical protein